MPELPEVETLHVYLQPYLTGHTITGVEVLAPKSFQGDGNRIIGGKIIELTRKGKVMTWTVDPSASFDVAQDKSLRIKERMYVNIHLKMSGALSWKQSAHTRVVITLDDRKLYFNDPRRFGWIRVTDEPEHPAGVDVYSDDFTYESFVSALGQSRADIKTVLMDQTRLAGVGNIYANDALWEARILPTRPTYQLTDTEKQKLFEAVKLVIGDGIKYGGSSKSQVYRLPDGTRGGYQNHFRVYRREGEKCARCGTKIVRIAQKGRSSWYCPTCQK